jgi:hypothetical protein
MTNLLQCPLSHPFPLGHFAPSPLADEILQRQIFMTPAVSRDKRTKIRGCWLEQCAWLEGPTAKWSIAKIWTTCRYTILSMTKVNSDCSKSGKSQSIEFKKRIYFPVYHESLVCMKRTKIRGCWLEQCAWLEGPTAKWSIAKIWTTCRYTILSMTKVKSDSGKSQSLEFKRLLLCLSRVTGVRNFPGDWTLERTIRRPSCVWGVTNASTSVVCVLLLYAISFIRRRRKT